MEEGKMIMTDKFKDELTQDLYNALLSNWITEEFSEWLLDNNFLSVPASTKYHGSFEGGLFIHSLNVYKTLEDMTKAMNLKWQNPRSPFIVGMFHDLCKIDAYKEVLDEETGELTGYDYNEDQLLKGHGDKSIILLSQFINLTEEEVMCIRYHMGAYDTDSWKEYDRAIKKYPNVLWTHTADMYASKVIEKK